MNEQNHSTVLFLLLFIQFSTLCHIKEMFQKQSLMRKTENCSFMKHSPFSLIQIPPSSIPLLPVRNNSKKLIINQFQTNNQLLHFLPWIQVAYSSSSFPFHTLLVLRWLLVLRQIYVKTSSFLYSHFAHLFSAVHESPPKPRFVLSRLFLNSLSLLPKRSTQGRSEY